MNASVRAPRSRRRRLLTATVVAGAALFGTPLLLGSPASAEPAGTVTFTGGCGLLGSGLGGAASANPGQVRVPAGTQLRFANQLGKNATLRLDGNAAGSVPAGGAAEVVFNDGPVTASMQIECALGAPAGTVTVEVVPAPAPSQPDRPDRPSRPDRPASGEPSTGPEQPAPAAPSGQGPTAPGGQAMPPVGVPGAGPGAEERPAGGPGGRDELSNRWRLDTDLGEGGASTTGPANVGPGTSDQDVTGADGEQLVSAAGSAPDRGPIGLLALIATVCLVGVSAGAIRTMIAQRATQARVA